MKPPRISIVMPSFNQASYISEAINSILNQEYENLELIVIDGGSDDGTGEILESYSDRLSYWCSESDGGQADALNKGFAKATGDIMGFVNSDDLLGRNSLQVISRHLPINKPSWINGFATTIYENSQSDSKPLLEYDTTLFTPPRHIRKHEILYGKLIIPQVSTFWNRLLWQKVGQYVDDCYYAFDYKLWLRFACVTPCRFVPRVIGILRYHDQSKTGKPDGMTNYLEDVAEISADFCKSMNWPLPSPFLHWFWTHYTWFKQGGFKHLCGKLFFL